jgi:hypothetical protein
MLLKRTILILFFFISNTFLVLTQSVTNPDISVIPRFKISTDDGSKLPDKREFSQPDFSMEEFEIALQAYLNPYAKADIFLTKAGTGNEPIEIEEAYATILNGLPLDLNVKFGKYKAEFGKLNMTHPHALPFITTPLSYERFMGDEGLNDLGLAVSYIIPISDDFYTRLTLDVLKGNSVNSIDPRNGKYYNGIGLMDTLNNQIYYANSGRFMSFFSLSDNTDFEIGLSELTGIHDPYNKYRFFYTNLDFKYKWKPNMYTGLVIQGEWLHNDRKIAENQNVSSDGFFIFADYQIKKIFSIGTRYDWSESPYSDKDKSNAVSLFFGYYPVEETMAFKLQYQNTNEKFYNQREKDINLIALEIMFSLGPHKVHPF